MSGRRPVRKAAARRKPVAGTPPWVMPAAVVAGVALVIAALLIIRWYNTPIPPKAPTADTTTQVITILANIPTSELDTVGQGTANNLIKPVSGTALTGATGKPEVLYIGAEYCPFCAAQRWPVIIALSRFGAFSGLTTTTSSSSDVYPNTVTFTFHGAKYTSSYVDFESVETSDRTQNPLQTPTAAQQQQMSKYNPGGTIPFLDFGSRYASTGAYYTPDSIGGMSWLAVAETLKQPDSPQAKAVLGSANLMTAAICKITNDQPSTVCSDSMIQGLEKNLK